MNAKCFTGMQRVVLPILAATVAALSLVPRASADEPKPDAELERLEEALDKATSQSQMNIAFGKIAEYWDKKLAEVEKKVTRKLTDVEKVEFEASRRRFLAYREKEVEFRTSFYSGGTIRSSMASGVYTSMTKQRVQEMEMLLAETLEPRADDPKDTPEEG
jgi:uncharacterized protein YecT (DUF1311 family)